MATRYLTVKQLAERVGVSPSTIRRRDTVLRPLRLGGRDRRYTEAHVALARRLLFGETNADRPAPCPEEQPLAEPQVWPRLAAGKADPAMAWVAADLAGEPLPPGAKIAPTYEREELDEHENLVPPGRARVIVAPEVWEELGREKPAQLSCCPLQRRGAASWRAATKPA